MKLIYIALSLFSLVYVVVKKRKFDFFSLAIMSSFIYYYPAYFGSIQRSNMIVPILPSVYGCIFLQLAILMLFVLYVDYIGKSNHLTTRVIRTAVSMDDNKEQTVTNAAVMVICWLNFVLLIMTMSRYGTLFGNFNKVSLLQHFSKVTEYFKYISLFILVYGFTNQGKYIRIIRIIALLTNAYIFFLGHRSFAVIGLLIVATDYVSKENGCNSLLPFIRKHKVFCFAAFFAAFFFFFVKNVFAAFMGGDYDLVWRRLTSKVYYQNMILHSEANVIIGNLQCVIDSDMKFSFSDYILSIFYLVPFLGGKIIDLLDVESFEYMLNVMFNPKFNIGIGLGSTYLGEAYATGGIFFVGIVMFLTYMAMNFLSFLINSSHDKLLRCFFMVILGYLAFYIHRNSLSFLLIMFRAQFYILMLAIFIRKFLKDFVFRKAFHPVNNIPV